MFQSRGAGVVLVSRATSNTLFCLLNCCTSSHLTVTVTICCSFAFSNPALFSLSPLHTSTVVWGVELPTSAWSLVCQSWTQSPSGHRSPLPGLGYLARAGGTWLGFRAGVGIRPSKGQCLVWLCMRWSDGGVCIGSNEASGERAMTPPPACLSSAPPCFIAKDNDARQPKDYIHIYPHPGAKCITRQADSTFWLGFQPPPERQSLNRVFTLTGSLLASL